MSEPTKRATGGGRPRQRGPFIAKPAYKEGGVTSGVGITLRGSWWYDERAKKPLVVIEVGDGAGRYLGTVQVRLTDEPVKKPA